VAVAEIASVDGSISPTNEAVLPLPDDGLYRGDGVFEVIRLYSGQPFALADHLDRLERSAKRIHLELDRPRIEIELGRLLERHGDGDAQLRIMATRGGRRILLIEPLAPRAEHVRIATVSYQPTVVLNRVKSLSYAANMHATRIAKERGADEAVLVTPEGVVLEPPTSTVFWVGADGVLRTPSLDNPILDSITRDRIVRAVQVEEGTFHVADLLDASEAFLASTTREVQPVSMIDDAELRWPGPQTDAAASAFTQSIAT
jgi:branched-chain amino acid aminotransferase